MPLVNELEARLNRSRAGLILSAVKELEENGNSRASEVLDFYEEHRLDIKGSDRFLPLLNEFILEHRDVLFEDEEEICGVSTGRLSMLFPAHNTVTFKYGIGEDNFGAIGVTFTLVGNYLTPDYIQVHDHTGFNIPTDYFNVDGEVRQALEYAFSFMKGEDEQVLYPEPGGNTYNRMTYPLIDPRISLHPDNCDTEQHTKTREAIFGLLNAIKELAPNTHLMITGSWNGSHNIDTDVFRLRTYDYHDDDATLTWNFVWRDIAVQWYKHPGRCLAINRLPSDEELILMSHEIIDALSTYQFQPEPPKHVRTLNEDPELVTLKLQNNSLSGAFGTPDLTVRSGVVGAQMLTEILHARKDRKKRLLDK